MPYEQDEAATPPERKRTAAKTNGAIAIYREIIKDNIDYDILIQALKMDKDRLDEIAEIMLETVCTARKTIRIAGDDYPAELVKSKFMKLNRDKKPSIRKALAAAKDKAKQLNAARDKVKKIDRGARYEADELQKADNPEYPVCVLCLSL